MLEKIRRVVACKPFRIAAAEIERTDEIPALLEKLGKTKKR